MQYPISSRPYTHAVKRVPAAGDAADHDDSRCWFRRMYMDWKQYRKGTPVMFLRVYVCV